MRYYTARTNTSPPLVDGTATASASSEVVAPQSPENNKTGTDLVVLNVVLTSISFMFFLSTVYDAYSLRTRRRY